MDNSKKIQAINATISKIIMNYANNPTLYNLWVAVSQNFSQIKKI